jgi:hypothetical protein
LEIPYAEGILKAKPPQQIIGGLLTLDSDRPPALSESLSEALKLDIGVGRLGLGCVAAYGTFGCGDAGCYSFNSETKAGTQFLFDLIGKLQLSATVPRIDIKAYASWLYKSEPRPE